MRASAPTPASLARLVALALVLLTAAPAAAQTPDTTGVPRDSLAVPADSLALPADTLGFGDPLALPTFDDVPGLDGALPDRMPLRTRLFWGEHGAFRAVGLAPETRAGELRLRRRMLTWHQRGGLVTFAALSAQVYLGQRLSSDRGASDGIRSAHRTLGYTSFGLYSATASLSILAPPAARYRRGYSSIKVHAALAVVHFAGMMAQPWLGQHLAGAPTASSYDRRLRTHQWVGLTMYGAYTAAIATTLLPR